MNWLGIKYILLPAGLSLVLFYLSLIFYLAFRQKQLIFLPTHTYPTRSPKEVGIEFEEHFYQFPNGDTIHLWFISAQNPTQETILFCHGNSGNLGNRLEIIKTLYNLGLNILIFDYRGYGASKGAIGEKTTYQDAEAMLNFLKEKKGITESHIIAYGRSLGGGVATEIAFRHPNIKGLILDSTFTSLPDIAQHYYPYIPVRWVLNHRYENIRKIKKITLPKLIIHSQEDEVIPISHAHRLYKAAKPPKYLLILPKGTHTNCFMVSRKEYLSGITEFLSNIKY